MKASGVKRTGVVVSMLTLFATELDALFKFVFGATICTIAESSAVNAFRLEDKIGLLLPVADPLFNVPFSEVALKIFI